MSDSWTDHGRELVGKLRADRQGVAARVFLCGADVPGLLAFIADLEKDRDEWKECSRDWRSRAERAEKVERIHRDALIRLSGGVVDLRQNRDIARDALNDGQAVECERVE